MSRLIGSGRYTRESYPLGQDAAAAQLFWQSRPSWILTGDPADDASPTTTIGTHTEFRRRIGFGPLQQNTTIAISASLPNTDVFDTRYSTGGFNVTYTGMLSATVITDQTINAFAARNTGAGTPNLLTADTPTTWGSFVGGGLILRMLDGAAAGCSSYVCKNVAANQARMGSFLNASTFAEINPAPGDLYSMLQMPNVFAAFFTFGDIQKIFVGVNFTSLGLGQSPNGIFRECAFPSGMNLGSGNWSLTQCQINGAPFTAGGINGQFFNGGAIIVPAGGGHFTMGEPGYIEFGLGAIFQGLNVFQFKFSQIGITDVGFFDGPAGASITMTAGSRALIDVAWGGTVGSFGLSLDKTSGAILSGAGQQVNGGVGKETSFPNDGAITWAAARAGHKDSGASNAFTLPT